jgi:hypothetical protein
VVSEAWSTRSGVNGQWWPTEFTHHPDQCAWLTVVSGAWVNVPLSNTVTCGQQAQAMLNPEAVPWRELIDSAEDACCCEGQLLV